MFKILDEVCTPKRGTKYSAYVDLFAREDITIGAGETKIVRLGIKLNLEMFVFEKFSQLPFDYVIKNNINSASDFLSSHYLEIALRSSLGVKGLIIANGMGIIDLDYPDEIGLIVHNPLIGLYKEERKSELKLHYIGNNKNEDYGIFTIKKGDKVAQCTLKEHKGYLMGYESEILRTGGFGNTGK